MVARADFIRTLLELTLDMVKGGEVRCGGSRAAPAPYLVDPVEDCDEGGGGMCQGAAAQVQSSGSDGRQQL